ncbi:sugar phosphate isomerase/epimerase [Brachybacterium sp. p3-SID957]|uniref:sugar phosphate isomerase/epimerase family protein n=1 Tax=Brachybacterium sp. p3-SID957 TaxID=2916049 RepID=UPI00223B0269|nr:sugar phosphate isomerase/epimerase family protein [Brachybacterium sp. p3-SID957]MCT1774963.1 sugar phosphate isomerase/epimerase [Brachybacterium sp. p3-SID957]
MTDQIRFGFSSYSFHSKLTAGEMTLPEVIDWVAASEGEHLELASLSEQAEAPVPSIASDPAYVDEIREKAASAGVTLSNLAVSADFTSGDEAEVARQVARVKQYVDLAERLGIERMRHDVAGHAGLSGDDTPLFEQALPSIAAASKEIARYAAAKGITTSLENHGFFVQSADRVRRIIHAVDEPNFRTTLDVGNFVCVDEQPEVSVAQNLPYAMVVHVKDFYIRPAEHAPGEGWFRSRGGKHLRGAVVGNGDIDLRAVARAIKESDFSGYAAIEFEGWEDCLIGCSRGIAGAKRLLAEA